MKDYRKSVRISEVYVKNWNVKTVIFREESMNKIL